MIKLVRVSKPEPGHDEKPRPFVEVYNFTTERGAYGMILKEWEETKGHPHHWEVWREQ